MYMHSDNALTRSSRQNLLHPFQRRPQHCPDQCDSQQWISWGHGQQPQYVYVYQRSFCLHNIDPGLITTFFSELEVGAYEAPGMFTVDGYYFLIVLSKTGYTANPNQLFYATSISGAWSGPCPIAPQSTNTYGSQNTFELVIVGSQANAYIYMGDAWLDKGSDTSNYVWLPMSVDTK